MAKKTEYSYLVLNLIFKMGMCWSISGRAGVVGKLSVMKSEKTTGSFLVGKCRGIGGLLCQN